MKPEVDITPALLKKESTEAPTLGVMDLTSVKDKDLPWLLEKKIISIPVLVRNIVAMKQNGVKEVLLYLSPNQNRILDAFTGHPIIGDFISFTSDAKHFLNRMNEEGAFWVEPFFLMNGIYLHAFEDEVMGENRLPDKRYDEIFLAKNSNQKVYWFESGALGNLSNLEDLEPFFKKAKEISFQDKESYGQEVRTKQDIKVVERILCEDITRKKGGFLAKILNEPISLWIAKYCALTPIRPNTVTLINTILGVFSAYLVVYGAQQDIYWPMAAGAILFYLVDIFDGIDGELARFTFRLSKNGALYDTISDNVILVAFMSASMYAAYLQTESFLAIYLGLVTVLLFVGIILYLLYFTTKYFGNSSLRLYEGRFLLMLPKSDPGIKFIEKMKFLYTKDIYAALISFAVLINQPILIFIVAPVFLILMFFAFIYMGARYGHLAAAAKKD